MRYSEDHKAQTRERIISEASRRFRRDGVDATGLQTLMKALGLTHGGFYAHFKSKDELVEIALQDAAAQLGEFSRKTFSGEHALERFIDHYLSSAHRDAPEKGCPFPTMSAELGARGHPSPTTDQMVEQRLAALQKQLPGEDNQARSITLLSTLVGALLLSRSVSDPAFSERILAATREQLHQDLTLDD
ncbi:MAG: HTH-type transcriptional regulator AcrR [Stenotrophomonas maltophilia]|nr:MAG: HTH-type transcriptional regulator AcrR [Stenotrophomonas maltophilia]